MRISGSGLRLGLFAALSALLCINALALWGDPVARSTFTVLQAATGVGAIVCAVVVIRRKRGLSRAWRLVVVAAFVSSLVGDLLWYAGRANDFDTAPPLAVAAYFMPPLLTLLIAAVVVRSGAPVSEGREGPIRGSRVITVLDGVVAAISFSLFVLISGFGDRTGAVLPRSDSTTVLAATRCSKSPRW